MHTGQLRCVLNHLFRYGPNPDMQATPGIRGDCMNECHRVSKPTRYRSDYRLFRPERGASVRSRPCSRLFPASHRHFGEHPAGHSSARSGIPAKTQMAEQGARGRHAPGSLGAVVLRRDRPERASATAIEGGPACRVLRWATMVKNQDLGTRPIGSRWEGRQIVQQTSLQTRDCHA